MRLKRATQGEDVGAPIIELARDTVESLDRAITANPHLLLAHRWAFTALYLTGDVQGFLDRLKIYHQVKAEIAAQHQLDRLGMRFVPSYPLMRTIGNTSVYEALVKCRTLNNDTSKLMLVYDRRQAGNFVNPHLITYWHQYMTVIDDPKTVRSLLPYAPPLSDEDCGPIELDGQVLYTHSAAALVQRRWEEENRPPLFQLREEDKRRGRQALRELGIKDDEWFACLHVREGGWKGDEHYRQAPIEDYIPAIEKITAQGGWVIRMGDPSMTPLPDMERTIDYAKSDVRCDWLDVYLCAACRFFVGTSSGVYAIAHAFDRPVVQTNYLPTSTIYMASKNLFLPKLARRNDTEHPMSFAEIMSAPFSVAANDAVVEEVAKATVINNTPQEIQEIVEEMMDRLDDKWETTEEDERLQTRFKDLTATVETLPGLPGVPLNCRIGAAFLRRHQSLLPANTAGIISTVGEDQVADG